MLILSIWDFVGQVWSEVYNRMSPPKQIDIFQMCVIRMQEGGQLYHVEHFIEGEYIKYNSNSGFVDEHMRHTPHAFSHFTFEHSGHCLFPNKRYFQLVAFTML